LDVLKRILMVNKEERITLEELLDHPWVKESNGEPEHKKRRIITSQEEDDDDNQKDQNNHHHHTNSLNGNMGSTIEPTTKSVENQ